MAVGSSQMTLLACLVAIASAIISPSVGIVILAVVVPLKSPGDLPPPGINSFLVGAVLLGSTYRLALDRPRLAISAPLVALTGFLVYAFVQQAPEMLEGWQGVLGHDVGYLFVQMLTGFGAILGIALVLRGRSPWPYLAASLVGASVAAALALATFGTAHPSGALANLVNVSVDLSRGVGPFGNPNYFGQFMATAFVLAFGIILIANGAIRTLALAVLPIVLAGLAVSLSRGGAVAAFTGILVLALTRGRRTALAVLAVGIPVALIAFNALVIERQGSGITALGAGTALADNNAGRLSAVLEGPRLFLTSPIFGVGFGHFVAESSNGVAAHNWYSNVLAEQGLFGIVTWCAALALTGVALRARPADPRSVGLGMFGAVVAGSLFLELPTSFQAALLPAGVITAALVADWGSSRWGPQGRAGHRISGPRSMRQMTIGVA
jgi:hypothetical protein